MEGIGICVLLAVAVICVFLCCSWRNAPGYGASPSLGGVVEFTTVNYNVFGRWLDLAGYEGQTERLKQIPVALAAYFKGLDQSLPDVVSVEEAWCPDSQLVSGRVVCGDNVSRNVLIDGMHTQGWMYNTAVVDKPGVSVIEKQTNGGCLIFSRWPIEATSAFVYSKCTGDDCSAAKGAVYARIRKTTDSGITQVFNVIATHMQAWSTEEGRTVRKGQAEEIRNVYVPALGIPTDGTEPLIFQGDFNMDLVGYPSQIEEVRTALKAVVPTLVGDQLFSSDPTNYLVGKDGAADQDGCLTEYKKAIGSGKIMPPTGPCRTLPSMAITDKYKDRFENSDLSNDKCYCTCCPREMLDFVMYSGEDAYLQPVKEPDPTLEIIRLESTIPLAYEWGWCAAAQCLVDKQPVPGGVIGTELSDHFPVVGRFQFVPKTKVFPQIDGCKTDDDCSYHALAGCYCTGATCTKANKKVNGWDLGQKDPVNANCHFRAALSGSCFCRPGDE